MTPKEIKTLSHAFFAGKVLQYEKYNGDWGDWAEDYCPCFTGFEWRIKPDEPDEPKKVRYCCYQELNGELRWFREGTLKGFKRIPELDREITLPEGV